MGQAKRQTLFEQTKAMFALVCGEATSRGDKASASCDFGRNWRRAVSTYAPRQLPKGGNLFLSSESVVKYAPSRGYIIFFPSLSLPYEKNLYVRTSFFISVCFRELKSFLTLNRGKKIIKKELFSRACYCIMSFERNVCAFVSYALTAPAF